MVAAAAEMSAARAVAPEARAAVAETRVAAMVGAVKVVEAEAVEAREARRGWVEDVEAAGEEAASTEA